MAGHRVPAMSRVSGFKQKFTHLLPTPDSGVFRSVSDARAYMLALSKESKPQSSSILSSECRFERPKVAGKFLYIGREKFWVRGVTYGAFRPDARGNEYHDLKIIQRDFAQMAANGLNAVRIPHTMPPRSLLDVAQEHGLRVMVGLSAEQYVGFLIDKKKAPDIEHCVRTSARACAGHPALLCYALGNEIPAPLVRWLGRRPVERYLERLYWIVKDADPEGLVTYVNYPTTEYLQLHFLDLVCCNIYLESQERYASYLARLQNLAGDRPLLMSEIGLDSLRHGEETQAHVLDWQIRTSFAAGCAGLFVFAWTDEWYRAGADVDDWAFGLTDCERCPKPALANVRKAFAAVPFPLDLCWPRISVIICTYNGSRFIRECLDGLLRLEYSNFEVVVVNDGSTDATAEIVDKYPVRLISTENRGLSSARNAGLEAATGEIVAYLDDDAYPDPHWLTYLAASFIHTTHAAVGGPNIPPAGDGPIADCVTNAPGGPVHVLLSDQEAEHIPGCNMAFRKAALQAIGGFDPQFRIAGDDVDICWRLQKQGWTVGFDPAAVVWHHRRNSVRAYWKQQLNYGKAEALLERKWPEKYNAAGHLTWLGRVYGNGHTCPLGKLGRIYYGVWGSAPFQSLYQPAVGTLRSFLLVPEWYLVVVTLGALSALGLFWRPLAYVVPLFVLAAVASLVQAALSAGQACFASMPHSRVARLQLECLTAFLHLLQPLARLCGRLSCGLTPWRQGAPWLSLPRLRTSAVWSERWQDPLVRLQCLETAMRKGGGVVVHGGEYDRWDLEVQGGLLGAARMLMAVEDHGAGTQFVRFRSWPRFSRVAVLLTLLFALLSADAVEDRAWSAAAVVGAITLLLTLRTLNESAGAQAVILRAIKSAEEKEG
jgi:GT2 family glycosyltransferase